jgi:asparagine synthase (glutamine-hydrolysing)
MSKLAGTLFSDRRPLAAFNATSELGISDSRAFVHRETGLTMGLIPSPASAAGSGQDGWLKTSEGSICAWDGRLDNAGSLATILGEKCASPAAYAFAIYSRKGMAGLRDLIGDWSLTLWDATDCSLILARDYSGNRPLYFHQQGTATVWASALRDLANTTGARLLDPEYAAVFLSGGNIGNRTPYRSVRSVRPGTALRVRQGRCEEFTFWTVPAGSHIRCHRDSDYEQRFVELFTEGAAARLTANAPVCAELSGGLDSSSVVCTARRLIGDRSVGASRIHTFSYTHKNSTDEKYFRHVEKTCGVAGIHLDLEEHPFVKRRSTGDGAPAWWGPRFDALKEHMSVLGSNVLLTGQLGDLVAANWIDDAEQAADSLREGQWLRACRQIATWSRCLRIPLWSMAWRTARSAWTSSVQDAVKRLHSPDTKGHSLTARCRREVVMPAWWFEVSPAARKRLFSLELALQGQVLQCPETLLDFSCTQPFAHRPLVEFMMQIPPDVSCGPGEPRRLMRRALANSLPEVIRRRRSKGTYDGLFMTALKPLAAELLATLPQMRLASLDFVDPDNLKGRLNRLLHGLECNEPQLRLIILLEFWLRNQEELSSRDADARAVEPAWSVS